MKCPSCHILRPQQILCSATVVKMLKNVSYNFSVYTDCNFVQDNLHLKKEKWQTIAEVVIIIVSASRLLIEIFKLFQEF